MFNKFLDKNVLQFFHSDNQHKIALYRIPEPNTPTSNRSTH